MNTIQRILTDRLPENFNLSNITTVTVPLCLGEPQDLNDGCHARFNTAIRGLGDKFSQTLIIQTGGTDENSLCDEMLHHVKKSEKYLWAQRFLSIPMGWGTRSEIAKSLLIIHYLSKKKRKGGIDTENPNFRVIFSSNPEHIPRIRHYVMIHNIDDLNVEYRESKHEFGLINTLREVIGLIFIKIKDKYKRKGPLREEQIENFLSIFLKNSK